MRWFLISIFAKIVLFTISPGRDARFMFRRSRLKTGMIRPSQQYVGMIQLSRPSFGIFRFSQTNKNNF